MMYEKFLSKSEQDKISKFSKEYFDALQSGEKDVFLRYIALSRVVNHTVLMMRHAKGKMKVKPGMVSLMCALAQDSAGLASHVCWLTQEFIEQLEKPKKKKGKMSK